MSCRGGDSIKLFSLEMEQFCIMTFVMVQKPTPVIKFHRAMHKKVHIKLMYQIIICILKSFININFLVYIMYIIVIYKYTYATCTISCCCPGCCEHSWSLLLRYKQTKASAAWQHSEWNGTEEMSQLNLHSPPCISH